MARLRATSWALVLLILVAYAFRAWYRLLGKTARDIAGGVRDGLPPALHDAGQAAVTVLLCAAWVILILAVVRGRRAGRLSLGGDYSIGAVLLVLTGLAMLVVLLATAVVHGPVPWLPVLAMVAAAAVAAAAIAGSGTPQGQGDARSAGGSDAMAAPEEDSTATRWVHRVVGIAAAAPLALLTWALVRDAGWLALYRPPASGDEANFWWRATEALHDLGFHDYLSSFGVAGYLPGYPLLANLLVGWIPDPFFAAAGRALPFLLGFACLWVLLRSSVTRRTILSPVAGLFYVLAYVLSESLGWVHSLLFELWYGESYAILAFALILVLVDAARRSVSRGRAAAGAGTGPGPDPEQAADLPVDPAAPALLALFGAGVAVLAVLSKPPLSFLLVPAILPTLAIFGWALRRRGDAVRAFAMTLIAMALAGLAAQALWGTLLRAYGLSNYYSIDLAGLLTFHPDGSFAQLGPYFFTSYEPVWVVFALTSVLALVHDWRRFLPFWLVSMGMIVSIFVLYLGAWSNVEHESGARYILHGAYGWTFFALAAMAPAISATLGRWIGAVGRALSWSRRPPDRGPS